MSARVPEGRIAQPTCDWPDPELASPVTLRRQHFARWVSADKALVGGEERHAALLRQGYVEAVDHPDAVTEVERPLDMGCTGNDQLLVQGHRCRERLPRLVLREHPGPSQPGDGRQHLRWLMCRREHFARLHPVEQQTGMLLIDQHVYERGGVEDDHVPNSSLTSSMRRAVSMDCVVRRGRLRS